MADPTKYVPSYSFSNFQTANPTKPLPGTSIDVELQNIAESLGGAVDGLKDIRRSDGKMANGIVDLAALSDEVITQLGGGGGGGGSGGVIFASQAQAEAGTSAAVVMSPLRVKQAIAAIGAGGGGGGPIAFSTLTGKPTTLGGYGISDAYTKLQVNAQIDAAIAAGGGGGGDGTDTPSQLLEKLKTVDGTSSGLDADTVDGLHAAELRQPENSVKTFGAVGDGTTDDTAAFEAALAARNVVYVPRGVYRLTRRLFKVGALTLHGDGEAQSKLVWGGMTDGTGGGLFVEVCKNWVSGSTIDKREECYVRDISVLTSTFIAGSKGVAVRRYNTNYASTHAAVLSHVTIGGEKDANVFINGWDTCLDLDGCDNANISHCLFIGKIGNTQNRTYDSSYAIKYHNEGGLASHPTQCLVSDCVINNFKTMIYVDDTEGFLLQHSQLVSGNIGVRLTGNNHYPHAEVSSCHINVDTANILVNQMWDLFIDDVLFYLQGGTVEGAMITLSNGVNYFSIHDCQFANAQAQRCNGIVVGAGCGRGIIHGNVFSGVNGVGTNTPGLGIWLTTGSLDTVVGDNYWHDDNVATRVLDGGTGNMFPGYGCRHAKTQAQTAFSNQATVINFEEPRNAYGNTETNMSSGAFVVPSTGVWQFDTTIVMNAGVEGGVEVSIVGDGTTYVSNGLYCHNNGVPAINVSSPPRFLVKNTAVRVQVYPTDHNRTVAATSNRCFFEGRRLS